MLNCTESRGEMINSDVMLVKANAIATSFISAGGIIGNLLIIAAFYTNKSLQNVTNIFLIQLACVDFTKAVFILIPKVYTQLLEQCSIKSFYCPISGFISTVSFVHSALLLAAIGLVRYVKMIHSSSFDRVFATRNLICYCLFLAVQTIALGVTPFLGAAEYKYSPYHGVCFTDWSNKNKGFRITFYVYTIGICYVTILFSYSRIYMKLRAHNSVTLVNLGSTKSLSHVKYKETSGHNETVPAGKKGSYRVKGEGSHMETSPDSKSYSSRSIGIREVTDVVLEEKKDESKMSCDDGGCTIGNDLSANDVSNGIINSDDPNNDGNNVDVNSDVNSDNVNIDDVNSYDVKTDDVNSYDVKTDDVNSYDVNSFDDVNDDYVTNGDINDDDDNDISDNDAIGRDSPNSEGEPQRIKPHLEEERGKNICNSERLRRISNCLNNAAKNTKTSKQGLKKDIKGSRLYLSEIKVTKIMFLIVIAYTLCWVPAFIINVYMFTHLGSNEEGNTKEVAPEVLYLIITLVDLKVFINPMIYGIMNTQFRKTIKALILKVFRI